MKTLKKITIFLGSYLLMQVPTLLMSIQLMQKNHSKLENSLNTMGIILSLIIIPLLVIHIFKKYSSTLEKTFTKSTYFTIIVAIIVDLLINKVSLPFMKTTGNANVDALQGIMSAFPILMVIYAMLIGPILEELLFRGLFMNLFFVNNPYLSIISSSIIFGAMHTSTDPIYLFSKIALGAVLGFVYFKTKNIKANIAVHIFNNVSALFFH